MLRRSQRITLIAALAVGGLSVVAPQSRADHFHVNCNGHGFVHGENTNDGSFFSRVDGGPCNHSSSCSLYQFSSFLGGAAASPGVTCNNWSRNYGNYQECPGWANVYLATRFDFHRHNAHNWCG